MKTGWIVLPAMVVAATVIAATGARAMETYCRGDGTRVFDGQETREIYNVVSSTARRVQLPGQTKPTTGCSINWSSLGSFYRPPELIERPKLGRAQVVNNYRIFYQSARTGDDTFAIRVHWVGWSTGKLESAVIHYDIKVIDHPI